MKTSRFVSQAFLTALCLLLVAASVTVAQTAQPSPQFTPTVGQAGKDVVWVPTPQTTVDKMLELAKITPQDNLIDLGSGDGRLVIAAAKRGLKAHGIEYNPDMVELSKKNAVAEGVDRKSTRLNSSHSQISYAVFCLKKQRAARQR